MGNHRMQTRSERASRDTTRPRGPCGLLASGALKHVEAVLGDMRLHLGDLGHLVNRRLADLDTVRAVEEGAPAVTASLGIMVDELVDLLGRKPVTGAATMSG